MSNHSAVVVTDYMRTLPGFLKQRMQSLAWQNTECGLQRLGASVAQHRGLLNMAQVERSDVRSMNHLQTVTPNGLIILGALFVALNGMAAIVCVAEVCWVACAARMPLALG